MTPVEPGRRPEPILLESFGVRLELEVHDPDLLGRVKAILPPGWQRTEEFPEDGHITVGHSGADRYELWVNGAPIVTDVGGDVVVQALDAHMRAIIAVSAPDRVFVHAGAVEIDGGALLLPGPSFAGKSTLTAELVRAGAGYLSDEFAVLDSTGIVYPYPRALSLRAGEDRYGTATTVESIGGVAMSEALEVRAIAALTFDREAGWDVARRSPGQGALALLANTVPARERPDESITAVTAAARAARVFDGTRGDADDAAARLIELIRSGEL